MARTVRLRRGTSEEHATFVGQEGELTYDTTLKQVRIHDGITAGGKILPNPPENASLTKVGLVQLTSSLTTSSTTLGLTASAGKQLKDSLQTAYTVPTIFPRACFNYSKKEVANIPVTIAANTLNEVHTLTAHGFLVGEVILYENPTGTAFLQKTITAVTANTFTTLSTEDKVATSRSFTRNLHGVINRVEGFNLSVAPFSTLDKTVVTLTFTNALPHTGYVLMGNSNAGSLGGYFSINTTTTDQVEFTVKNSSGQIVSADSINLFVMC